MIKGKRFSFFFEGARNYRVSPGIFAVMRSVEKVTGCP
jgi:hypothetical protein